MNQTEANICQAALELFAKQGFAATSIREIADVAAINSATMYYYYKNKDELLFKIMDVYMTNYHDYILDGLTKCASPIEQFTFLMREHLLRHEEESVEAIVFEREIRSLSEPFAEQIVAKRKAYEQLFQKVLQEGVDRGLFHTRDIQMTAYACIGLCTTVAHWYKQEGRLSIQEIADIYVEFGLKLLGVSIGK